MSACRWQSCKLLAKEEQRVDTGGRTLTLLNPKLNPKPLNPKPFPCPGIPLATATWFILRLPHQEMLQDPGNAFLGPKNTTIS